jgi:hypothetical protein
MGVTKERVRVNPIVKELELRWAAMFTALAAGADLPPAHRLRTEGMMESAVLLELATADQLDEAMDQCYRAAIGRGLAQDFDEDWRDFHRFPEIPAVALRAPVYPSTRD